MNQTGTVTLNDTGTGVDLGGVYQVVLYNDDVNTFEHVVACLIEVFGHNQGISEKLAMEAHHDGRTIAQVEGHPEAVLHKEQLVSYGITAEVEKI
jgi:ATP-dependent Clp protease adaptor protein ClpS